MPTPHATPTQTSTGEGDESHEEVTKPSSKRARDTPGAGEEDPGATRPVPTTTVVISQD